MSNGTPLITPPPLYKLSIIVCRRIREKYEAELREVERSERSTLEKFNSMKVCIILYQNTSAVDLLLVGQISITFNQNNDTSTKICIYAPFGSLISKKKR